MSNSPHGVAELRLSPRSLAVLWLLSGLLMVIGLGQAPVARTQEARVLETARQMIDGPWRQFFSPTLNDEPRLRKPPVCYWTTLASYELFGVSRFTGRLPAVLCGWLAIGLTYCFARDLISRRAGFYAAAALSAFFYFARFARHAETDVPAMLGVLLAMWALWRMTDAVGVGRASAAWIGWAHLAAVGVAFAGMTKGGPALYPVLFIPLLAMAVRSTRPIRRFIGSGAILTGCLLALPWFIYVIWFDPAGRQVRQELGVVAGGDNHFGWFWEYLPYLLFGLLPWTPIAVMACIGAVRDRKQDERVRVLFAFLAAVFIPLAIVGNKQPHYLIPLLPAIALLCGWLLERAADPTLDPKAQNAIRWTCRGTLIAMLIAGIAVPIALPMIRGAWLVSDVVASALLVGGAAIGLRAWRTLNPQLHRFAMASAIAMPFVAGVLAPTIGSPDAAVTAGRVRELAGDRPLCFVSGRVSIPLSFEMRRRIPAIPVEQVPDFWTAHPDGVVIRILDDTRKTQPEPPPGPTRLIGSIRQNENVYELYEQHAD